MGLWDTSRAGLFQTGQEQLQGYKDMVTMMNPCPFLRLWTPPWRAQPPIQPHISLFLPSLPWGPRVTSRLWASPRFSSAGQPAPSGRLDFQSSPGPFLSGPQTLCQCGLPEGLSHTLHLLGSFLVVPHLAQGFLTSLANKLPLSSPFKPHKLPLLTSVFSGEPLHMLY